MSRIPLRIKSQIFYRPADNLVQKRRPLTSDRVIKISLIIPWFERSTAISLAKCSFALTIQSGASIRGEEEKEDPISTTPGGRLLSSRSPRTCPRYLMQFPLSRRRSFPPSLSSPRVPSAHRPPPFSARKSLGRGARGAINCSYSNQLLNYDSGELVTTASEILLAALQP